MMCWDIQFSQISLLCLTMRSIGHIWVAGYSYFGCVTNPNDANQAWCSEDNQFSGRWHKCHWRCPDELGPVSAAALHTPSSNMQGRVADGNPPTPLAGLSGRSLLHAAVPNQSTLKEYP